MTWPALPLEEWQPTRDTLNAHTQVLGKLAVALAHPEHQLMHTALRLTARGWETQPLPAPNGSGLVVVALDLREHEAVVEHDSESPRRIPLTPHRSVADVTHDVLTAVGQLGGSVEIDMKPQETPWTTPLDEDTEHSTYEPKHVERYLAAAANAARVLAALRAPYIGRSTPVNAWWGAFDLGVTLFSGSPAAPTADGFLVRNSMNAEHVAAGWWPGDARYPRPAFYAYAYPSPRGLEDADVAPGRWDGALGEFLLDWDDARAAAVPHEAALTFLQAVAREAMRLGEWPPELAASLDGVPPPVT